MKTDNPAPLERAKLSFELEDEEPEAKQVFEQKIETISEKAGFARRQAPKPARQEPKAQAAASAVEERPRRQRARTGRTYPFNTRIRPDTYDTICRLADQATATEGRPVSLAEIIERAIASLEGGGTR
jgi:hypothetical protein